MEQNFLQISEFLSICNITKNNIIFQPCIDENDWKNLNFLYKWLLFWPHCVQTKVLLPLHTHCYVFRNIVWGIHKDLIWIQSKKNACQIIHESALMRIQKAFDHTAHVNRNILVFCVKWVDKTDFTLLSLLFTNFCLLFPIAQCKN